MYLFWGLFIDGVMLLPFFKDLLSSVLVHFSKIFLHSLYSNFVKEKFHLGRLTLLCNTHLCKQLSLSYPKSQKRDLLSTNVSPSLLFRSTVITMFFWNGRSIWLPGWHAIFMYWSLLEYTLPSLDMSFFIRLFHVWITNKN